VIYICDSYEMSETDSGTWSRRPEATSPGTEIISELSPAPSDFVVRKNQYSSPFSADLDILIKELGVTRLVLTGTAVDVCIYFIARDAHRKGYQIIVPQECVVSLSEGDREASLQQIEQLFNAEIV
jgi:nicotinamidase-related amidase